MQVLKKNRNRWKNLELQKMNKIFKQKIILINILLFLCAPFFSQDNSEENLQEKV